MSAEDAMPDSTRADPIADAVARAESDVERTRERVASSMLALREEVARQVDWRRYVRARPAAFLAGALVFGFWLGYRRR
jgi:hypothetical protein